MGACDFYAVGKGKTPREAFDEAHDHAQWESGHGGYTGTIAEKHDFVMIPLPEGVKPYDYAEKLISEGDSRVDDKWGPAGCVPLGEGKWLFFGYASS
jgi:hypothetical protein